MNDFDRDHTPIIYPKANRRDFVFAGLTVLFYLCIALGVLLALITMAKGG